MSKTYNTKNQLTSGTSGTSGTSFVYDGNGNPTTYNGVGLTFDPENKATVFGTQMTAGYTIEGLRAWKQNTTTGAKTYFLYDGMTPVVELDSTGAVSATNTVGANGLISRNTSAGGSVFYTFDERGTTAQRLDGSGSVLSSHLADAFGTMAFTSATTDPYDGFGAQFGYYTDHETGLVLCTFRYYDPSNGRWLNRDPIGYDGGMNLYAYCLNNPVMAIDPSGLDDNGPKYVHSQIASWQSENLMSAKENHGADGMYDYKIHAPTDRFMVHGTWLSASQFGQYAAGYAGYYTSKGFGLWGVQAGGHFLEASEDNRRTDGEVTIWADDGMIDKQLIMLGAVDAYMDLRAKGLDKCPKLGWQTRPGANKKESLNYLHAYNKKHFGSRDANPDSPFDQPRNGVPDRRRRNRL